MTYSHMTIAVGNSPFDEIVSIVCVTLTYCLRDSFVCNYCYGELAI